MTPEKEKELLTALSKGNQSAFDSLYLFYAPKVREFVFRLLKNPGEAEDVTQNIFLRVWEKRRELGGTRSLRSYLYTMARNAVFDIFSHSIVEDKYMQEHINSAAERRDAPLSEKIETEELALLIAVAVDRMPEQRRRVFSLSRYEELSNKEIAERQNRRTPHDRRPEPAPPAADAPRPLRLKTRPENARPKAPSEKIRKKIAAGWGLRPAMPSYL